MQGKLIINIIASFWVLFTLLVSSRMDAMTTYGMLAVTVLLLVVNGGYFVALQLKRESFIPNRVMGVINIVLIAVITVSLFSGKVLGGSTFLGFVPFGYYIQLMIGFVLQLFSSFSLGIEFLRLPEKSLESPVTNLEKTDEQPV